MVAGKTEVAELEIGAENSGWMAMPLIQKKRVKNTLGSRGEFGLDTKFEVSVRHLSVSKVSVA